MIWKSTVYLLFSTNNLFLVYFYRRPPLFSILKLTTDSSFVLGWDLNAFDHFAWVIIKV